MWRVGNRIPVNVYEGDVPVCYCRNEKFAQRIVEAMNAPVQASVNFEELARVFETAPAGGSHPEYRAGRQFCADALRLAIPERVKKALEDHDAELFKKWSAEETR